jgi:hypothetical protein
MLRIDHGVFCELHSWIGFRFFGASTQHPSPPLTYIFQIRYLPFITKYLRLCPYTLVDIGNK